MKLFIDLCASVALGLVMALAAPAVAQDAPDRVDDIVVVARRAGAPMWEVQRGDATVILVGAISGAPRDTPWRPEALEAATARSQRILSPQEVRASITDIFRLLWRIRTIARLPEGRTTADYLSPEWQARLDAVMAEAGNDRWRTESLVGLSFELLNDKAGFERRGGPGAVEAVRRAAREARVPMRPVGLFRGDEAIDNLITAPPETWRPCVEASIAAAEAGPAGNAARIDAWRRLKVPEVLATPLDQALYLCWPSGDPEIAPLLRTQWAEAVQQALSEPGVTMGVAPLRLLAEPGGVLDQLEAQGLDIVGPAWKVDPQAVEPQ